MRRPAARTSSRGPATGSCGSREVEEWAAGKPDGFEAVRHGSRRRGADRLHHRHDRPAEGHDALPPRRARDVRHVLARDRAPAQPTTSSSARRRSRSRSASAASCRSRCASARPRCLLEQGAPDKLLDGDRSATAPRPASRRRPPTARMLAARRGRPDLEPAPLRLGGRDAAAPPCRRPGTSGHGHPRSSTASARRRCFTSSSAPRTTTSAPARPGRPVPGYEARDRRRRHERRAGPGVVGRLAVRGPTGCRYLDDAAAARLRPRRLEHHRRRLPRGRGRLLLVPGAHRRHDRLGGYNIAGPEVEEALLDARRPCSSAPSSARPTPSAGTSSRRSSCWGRAASRATPWRASSRTSSRRRSRRTSTRAPSSSSTRCRARETGKVQRFVLREREA